MTEISDVRLSMAERVEELGVNVADATFEHIDKEGGHHWRVTLACDDRQMVTPFFLGSAHGNRTPIAEEVIGAIASDVSTYENADGFEDWCREYDYDSDSIKNLRTYNEIGKQRDELKHLLGSDAAYEALLWNTESD